MIYPQIVMERAKAALRAENDRLKAENAEMLTALKKFHAHLDAFDEEAIKQFLPERMGIEICLLVKKKIDLQALIAKAQQRRHSHERHPTTD